MEALESMKVLKATTDKMTGKNATVGCAAMNSTAHGNRAKHGRFMG